MRHIWIVIAVSCLYPFASCAQDATELLNRMKAMEDKIKALDEIIAEAGVSAEECAFVGDDVADIPPMRRVGLAVAVADAVAETKLAAHYVTDLKGGRGAVREVCELILKSQGRWPELMRSFTP